MISCSRLLKHELGELSHLHFTKPKAPVIVWNLTGECNLSCVHCYNESGPGVRGGMIGTSDAKAFIDDIKSIGSPALLFSGGEPLLREDLFELGRYAKEIGVHTALSTNGTLITKDAAQKIKEAGFSYVGVSLDGMKETHDRLRKLEGAFELTMNGLKNCIELGIKTGVRFTLSKHNYAELDELLDFLPERGIDRFCLYHLVYSGKGRASPEDDLDRGKKREVMDSFFSKVKNILDDGKMTEVLTVDSHADGVYMYHRLKEKDPELGDRAEKLISNGSGCSAGVGVASVDHEGNVHPCQFWGHVSVGNIKERKFSEIWYDKDNEFLSGLRDSRNKLKGRCGSCKYKAGCGGCRLRAERISSDMWEEDPACYLTVEEITG